MGIHPSYFKDHTDHTLGLLWKVELGVTRVFAIHSKWVWVCFSYLHITVHTKMLGGQGFHHRLLPRCVAGWNDNDDKECDYALPFYLKPEVRAVNRHGAIHSDRKCKLLCPVFIVDLLDEHCSLLCEHLHPLTLLNFALQVTGLFLCLTQLLQSGM